MAGQASVRSAAVKSLLVTLAVMTAVSIAPRLVRASGLVTPAWQGLVAAALFGLLIVPVVRSTSAWIPSRIVFQRSSRQLVAATLFAGSVAVALGWWPSSTTSFTTVVLLAVIEELVFRVAVPRRLAQTLSHVALLRRDAWLCGQLAAQVLFAASHFVSREGLWTSRGLLEGARLFSAGVLYANVVQRRGFWLAAGLHASLNLGLRASKELVPYRASLVVTAVCAVVGGVGLFKLSRSAGSYAIPA